MCKHISPPSRPSLQTPSSHPLRPLRSPELAPWATQQLVTSHLSHTWQWIYTGFPDGSKGEESTCKAGDLGSIPGSGRSPGGGRGNLLQYSYLENPHGERSLAGCSPRGRQESDTTEQPSTAPCVYVSPNSQFVLPFPLRARLSSVCVSLLLPCKLVHLWGF